jgi:membrane-bound lytic murein transglycosylase D
MKKFDFKRITYTTLILIASAAWATTPALAQRYLSHNELYTTSSFSLFNAGNLWDAMRHDFKLGRGLEHPTIKAEAKWFSKNQQYLDRTTSRASPYLYYIYDQVKKRDLPAELALLPIVESAYNPFALSNKGAAGIWQFMPGTARSYGLKANSSYDGRRDIVESTRAALDHLTYLHEVFEGDWLLAIAAYNSGEGLVKSAIERNRRAGKDTDFWSLPLPAETKRYVPKLIALARVIKTPDDYDVQLSPIRNAPYFAQVDLDSAINLEKAAEYAEIEVDQLHALNPGFKRAGVSQNSNATLLLPIRAVNKFNHKLHDDDGKAELESSRWAKNEVSTPASVKPKKVLVASKRTQHTIRSGETLSSIAKRYGVAIHTLTQWNHMNSHKKLVPGQQLTLWLNKRN